MSVTLAVLLGALTGVICIPPPTQKEESLMRLLSKEEFTSVTSYQKHPFQFHSTRTSFKHKYVYCNGGVADYKSGTCIDITATAAVSGTAHAKAATIISRMVQHMPSSICNNLAARVKVGVFTKHETMLVYSANSYVADRPECRGTCGGSCSNTCTFDGRKYSTLAGSGGSTTTILDDNILCDAADPYYHKNSILVHEFTHTIHGYGVDAAMKTRIKNAYNAAKSRGVWERSSYAMANDQEYLAQGAAAYFNTNHNIHNGQYMNECSPGRLCSGEMAARRHIYDKDRELYNILTWIFLSNDPSLPSHLSTCV